MDIGSSSNPEHRSPTVINKPKPGPREAECEAQDAEAQCASQRKPEQARMLILVEA